MDGTQPDNLAPSNSLDALLSLPVVSGAIHKIDELESLDDTHGQNLTARDVILIKLTEKAIDGDLRAIELIVKIAGNTFSKQNVDADDDAVDPRL